MKNATTALLFVALALGACADNPISPPGELPDALDQETLRPLSGLSAVVVGISRALTIADVRHDILAGMRASTRVEHGLLLTPYLQSPSGAALLGEAARALGMTEAAFVAHVEALRELEISVPVREQRLSWTGTAAVAVGGAMRPDVNQLVVHEPSGLRQAVALDAIRRYDAFFYVRPRETFGTRIGRQPDVPGPVIQDPDDGEQAIITTWQIEGRAPVSIDHGLFESEQELRKQLDARLGILLSLATAYQCAESANNDCGGGGDPQVTDSPTNLDKFVLDIATEPGTEEVEITVGYGSVSGTQRYEGVYAFTDYSPGDEILSKSPAPGGTGFYVSAVETDWLFDDHLGFATFRYADGGISLDLSLIGVDLSW